MDDNEKNVKKESFWYKYKNDKKYNAKIQLVVYALFIIIVVVYVNTSHVGNNYNYDNYAITMKKFFQLLLHHKSFYLSKELNLTFLL